jgi:CheY-like chemotaxis protein
MLRLLYVDDHADSRDVMQALLESGGFAVEVAATAAEALAKIDRPDGTYQLVLCDLALPDLDGWDVLRRLKRVSPSTPFVLLTGWAQNLDHQLARRRGVAQVLTKPVAPAMLAQRLGELARGKT